MPAGATKTAPAGVVAARSGAESQALVGERKAALGRHAGRQRHGRAQHENDRQQHYRRDGPREGLPAASGCTASSPDRVRAGNRSGAIPSPTKGEPGT